MRVEPREELARFRVSTLLLEEPFSHRRAVGCWVVNSWDLLGLLLGPLPDRRKNTHTALSPRGGWGVFSFFSSLLFSGHATKRLLRDGCHA